MKINATWNRLARALLASRNKTRHLNAAGRWAMMTRLLLERNENSSGIQVTKRWSILVRALARDGYIRLFKMNKMSMKK